MNNDVTNGRDLTYELIKSLHEDMKKNDGISNYIHDKRLFDRDKFEINSSVFNKSKYQPLKTELTSYSLEDIEDIIKKI